jgi:arylsulfatase A-like enzyme
MRTATLPAHRRRRTRGEGPRLATLPGRRRLLLAAVVAWALLSACPTPPATGFLVPFGEPTRPLAEDEYESLGIRFTHAPRSASLTVDGERRPVLLTTPEGWTWRGRVPEGARLRAGVQALSRADGGARGFTARVALRQGLEHRVLVAGGREPGAAAAWVDLAADLAEYGGEVVTLELSADVAAPAAAGADEERVVAWGPVALQGAAVERRGTPSIVLVVVDALRADHLGAYGYPRATSPHVDRLLAGRGTLFEEAYAQAPWTLPSALSYLTGRFPGELFRPSARTAVVPAGVATLAERLRAAGYRTGAYVANPTLHPQAGFDRGFETWWTPPAEVASLSLSADSVNRRALPWLEAHRGVPFFLYLHYLDPHDPYTSPALTAGRSPFDPTADSPLTGDQVHAAYLGQVEVDEAGRERLTALYDSEIAYVDEAIGEVLAALEPLRPAPLTVLTADHGEELGDHGGWKHGHTLYNEVIRVPFVFRWDGRIPERRRIAGSVRLVDLVPTLLAAAGAELTGDLDGIDLLPVLLGIETLPRRAALGEHLSFGPLRAMAVLDDWKLILFNEAAPYEPTDPLQVATWARDRERLSRLELYDLASDPGETENRAAADPDRVEQLAPLIHAQLDRELPGLKVLLDDVPRGRRVTGRFTFAAAPEGWWPYFLAAGDSASLEGHVLTFDLRADVLQKGLRVLGETGALESAEVAVDGVAAPPGRILLGRGVPYRGGRVPLERLTAREWPFRASVPGSPLLRLWRHRDPDGGGETAGGAAAAGAADEVDEETRRRLKALGYLG